MPQVWRIEPSTSRLGGFGEVIRTVSRPRKDDVLVEEESPKRKAAKKPAKKAKKKARKLPPKAKPVQEPTVDVEKAAA